MMTASSRQSTNKLDQNLSCPHYDIAIVGSGIVGLSLAIRLAQLDLRVVVIDKNPQASNHMHDGHWHKDLNPHASWVSALNTKSMAWLKMCGIGDQLLDSQFCSSYEAMTVKFSEFSDQLHLNASDVSAPQLGWVVSNAAIKSLLSEQLSKCDQAITLLEDEPIAWMCRDRCMRLKSGNQLTSSLVVGADGVHSWVRQQMQCEYSSDRLTEGAWVGTFKHQYLHQACARQVFSHLGVVAMLPLYDPAYSVCVWSCDRSQKNQALSYLNNGQALSQWFPDLGHVELVEDCRYLPIHSGQSSLMWGSGCVLVGDAATCVHPLAGQGLNLGLRSAYYLAQEIIQAHRVGSSLWSEQQAYRYEQLVARHNRITRQFIIACLKVSKSGSIGRYLGNLGFSALDGCSFLKQPFIRHAMG